MIGRTTLLWLALAMIVGIGLFSVKYQVMALEDELVRLNAATLREQNQIHVLQAEWSYLNRPSRLADLAETYLGLKAISPQQRSTVAALPLRPAIEPNMPDDPNRIAKMVPPRKPPVPSASARLPNPPARIIPPTTAAPAVNAAATAKYPSQPTNQPLPAPVTAVGLTGEGRPLKDRP